jgi:hypothetical protein
MARSFGRLYVRIWTDQDWRALDVNAQHLYCVLISQESMNLAGVLPLQLRKWSSCVNGWDIADVAGALDRLREARFVLVDEDTEEVLIRTLIRNDEAYKTPGMLKSILKSAEHTQAPALRRELAVELGRLDALEGKKAEEGTALIAATRVALLPNGTPPDDGVIHRSEPIPDGIGDGITDGFLGTHPRYLPNHSTEPIPDTSVSVSVSVPSLALVRSSEGEGTSPTPLDEPENCARHTGMGADAPPCRACQRLRENWEMARDEAAKPKPKPPWCGDCDERSRKVEVVVHGRDAMQNCKTCHPLEVAS